MKALFSFFVRSRRVDGPTASFYVQVSVLLLLVSVHLGCTTLVGPRVEKTVSGEAGTAEGQWRGKGLVRDLVKNKSATIDLDIIAREPSKLRMEISGSFGVHVASIALNGDVVRSVLTQQKRFVEAPATSAAMARLIPIRISPKDLLRLLFDRPLDSRRWKCQGATSGALSSCTHVSGDVKIDWLERSGETRRLRIGATESTAELVLSEAKSKVEFKDQAFRLEPPDGFKKELLTPN